MLGRILERRLKENLNQELIFEDYSLYKKFFTAI